MPFGSGSGGSFSGGPVTRAIDVTDPAAASTIQPGLAILGVAGLGVAPLTLTPGAGQTDDIIDVFKAGGAVAFVVIASGHLLNFATAAPASADVATSSVALWLDATPAATKLMVKAKDSGGTVKTGSLALV
jgi:aspartokinase-like uncharacterized kinase